MNILWCGGEDIDFPFGDVPSFSITTGRSRVADGWSRGALGTTTESDIRSMVFPGGKVTSCWLSVWVYISGVANKRIVGLTDSDNPGKGIFFGIGSATNKFGLMKFDGTTQTVLASQVDTMAVTATLLKVCMQIISYGASATINLYVSGSLVLTYSGDISISGVSGFDQVAFRAGGAGYTVQISECIVADGDIRASELHTRISTSTDGDSEWDGTHEDIDEITISDADSISTNAADEDALLGLTSLPAGDYAVDAVRIAARAIAPSGATANKLLLGIESNGTPDLDSGQNVGTGWATYQRIAQTLNGAQIQPTDTLLLNLRSATAS